MRNEPGITQVRLLKEGIEMLRRSGVDEAEEKGRLLLEYVCGSTRAELLSHPERMATEEEAGRFRAFCKKAAEHVPLQYLTGKQYFMGLEWKVTPAVLIPRGDTEILTERVLKDGIGNARILDLCTGSGCILLSLLHYEKTAAGLGTDISPEALEVAAENAKRILAREEERAAFRQGDLFEGVPAGEKFDVITANPPYIVSSVVDTLMPEVRDHEPRLALDGGEDGLALYRRILDGAGTYLREGGRIYMEIGYDQGESVSALAKESGFREVEVLKDYGGLDRVVLGRL